MKGPAGDADVATKELPFGLKASTKLLVSALYSTLGMKYVKRLLFASSPGAMDVLSSRQEPEVRSGEEYAANVFPYQPHDLSSEQAPGPGGGGGVGQPW